MRQDPTVGKRSLGIATALLGLVVFAGLAWAAGSAFMTGGGVWTEVSGIDHVFTRDYAPNSSKEGLHGFTVTESADDPYSVELHMLKLCSQDCPRRESNHLRFDHPGALTFQDWTVKADEDRFVTAVQVCFNGKEDPTKKKIKGLRVWGASIDPEGKLLYESKYHEKQLNNCTEWRNKVSCPDGKVATGARAHFVSDRTGFSGLALWCAAPKKIVE